MKKNSLLFWGVVLFGFIIYPSAICAKKSGSLRINPDQLTIQAGKSKAFKVFCTEEKNAQVQDQCAWQVQPDSIGSFIGPEFEAKKPGSGIIIVDYKDYCDTITVEVFSKTNDTIVNSNGSKGYPKITFEKNHLSLNIGDTVKVSPTYLIAKDSAIDVPFEYDVKPVLLGTIASDGIFYAEYPGNGRIIASYNDISGSVSLKISKENGPKYEVFPGLEIVTKRVNIKVGEFVELMTVYTDSTGYATAVSSQWRVQPYELGHFSDSLFFSDSVGKGYIFAEYSGFLDSIPVNVQPFEMVDNVWSNFRIEIEPSDTIISLGDSVQYTIKAYNKNNWQLLIDSTLLDSVTVEWSVVGHDIGMISEEGLFIAYDKGFALIKAKLNGEKTITTRVFVDEAISDSTGINSVEIQRVLPNGNILPSKTFNEGESYKISGLPFPLNVLNGGLLYFPVGSLKEDISIFMLLPEQIHEDSTGVILKDSILAGVKFLVMVADSIIEPYYFEKPLVLSIPYKADLLDSLGIEPEQIGVFFSEDGDYISSGIENVLVDTVKNRIIADVVHFSSIIVRKSFSVLFNVSKAEIRQMVPITNAPNPFVNQTLIKFNVEGEKDVRFVIYDISGKLISSYVFEKVRDKLLFIWDATNKNGAQVNPGIYLGQLYENGEMKGFVKMIKID